MSKCLLVGTVSNVSKEVSRDLEAILASLSRFSDVSIFLVESDSSDATLEVLEAIKAKNRNFDYITLGLLRTRIPDRIERIRFCRNEYVRFIRELSLGKTPDYVIVADLDGMNRKITEQAVDSSFIRHDWDAVFANQRGGYYDILALRHDIWQPGNYSDDLVWYRSLVIPVRSNYLRFYEMLRLRLRFDKARKLAIYNKMLRLTSAHPWIEVNSAFGGLGIYRSQVFLKHDYSSLPDSKSGVNEHVTLHSKMRNDGLRLFINPSLINSNWNTYNINRFFVVRQVRQLVWGSKPLSSILSLARKAIQK